MSLLHLQTENCQLGWMHKFLFGCILLPLAIDSQDQYFKNDHILSENVYLAKWP